MKAASVNEIKQQLKELGSANLVELCLRLARYKKENKELLTYLLFEANDLPLYINHVRQEIDEGFMQMNISNIYLAKKSLRKILRSANKYIRYIGSKTAEVEILLHYLTNFKGLKLSWHKSTALINLYNSQIKKITSSLTLMHEDLQHDYLKDLHRLEL